MINRHTHKKIFLLVYVMDIRKYDAFLKNLQKNSIDVYASDNKQKVMSLLRSHEVAAVLTVHESENYHEVNFLRYIMQQYPHIQRILMTTELNSDIIEYAVNKAHINYIIHSPSTEEKIVDIIRKGFKRYLDVSRPFEKIDELIEYVQKFKHEAYTDPLTQLLSRRTFDDVIDRAYQLYQDKKIPVTLIMLDLDNFKKLNDTYGHPAGDQVLREFAVLLKKNSRTEDSVFRYGGEEFAIVAHGSSTEKIQLFVDRILQEVRETVVKFENKEIRFTFSAGIETLSEEMTTENLIRRADAALYFAKANGRNQVIVFKSDMISLIT
jgi:diguanylate cyclase (GGDEF)-like protein